MNFEERDNEKQVQVLAVALMSCAKQLEEAQTELHEMKEKSNLFSKHNYMLWVAVNLSFLLGLYLGCH